MEWSDKRVAERTEKLKENPDFSEWFKDLSNTEQQRATKVFNAITKNDNLAEEKVNELAGYVRDIFKFDAFQDLSQKIEEATTEDVPMIIDLFRDWEHLEASEMYRKNQLLRSPARRLGQTGRPCRFPAYLVPGRARGLGFPTVFA